MTRERQAHATPVLAADVVSRWRCAIRGLCCREDWDLPIDRDEWRHVVSECERAGGLGSYRQREPGVLDGWMRAMPRDADGACVFCDGPRCGLRMAVGTHALPFVCAAYPFLAQQRPAELAVGLDLTCPTAAALAIGVPFRLAELAPDALLGHVSVDALAEDYTQAGIVYALGQVRVSAPRFWEAVRSVLASDEDPLRAAATALCGVSAPAASAPPCSSAARTPPIELLDWAAEHGLRSEAMRLWWSPVALRDADEAELEVPDDVALRRYAQHRLWMPVFLGVMASGHRLTAGVAALVARARLELARGRGPRDAVRAAEKALLSTGALARLVAMHEVFAPVEAWWGLARAPWVSAARTSPPP